jgi:hypothetical protein
MKTLHLLLIILLVSFGNPGRTQRPSLPDVDIFTLEGIRIRASAIVSRHEPIVIFFWKSNDIKSMEQLDAINEAYDEKLKAENIRIVGICTDGPGTMHSIKPFVCGSSIDIEIYSDPNNDLRRAMNVPETPFTFLFIPENNSIYAFTGYNPNIAELISKKIDRRIAGIPAEK